MGPIVDYQKAKQALELLKVQRAGMAERLRPKHPDMIAIDDEIKKETDLIEELRGESVEALKTQRDSVKIQIDNLNGVIDEWQTKARDTNVLIAEFDRIKAKADRDKEEYERQLIYMNSVTDTKNIDQDSMVIMDHASDGVSIKPGWVKIILIGFGGGLFGHGTLTATMNHAPEDQRGLALGAWGAVQASAAGLAVGLGGVIRDIVAAATAAHPVFPSIGAAATGYTSVYAIEVVLLLVTIVAMARLTRPRPQGAPASAAPPVAAVHDALAVQE